MSAPSFDLGNERWLPVTLDGTTVRVGFRELFARAHEFDDLVVPVPPAAAGLWRILYAITARLTGLDHDRDWAARQGEWLSRGRFDIDAINSYFDRYRDRFDLFHPGRPWMQDPRLRHECSESSGVNKLVMSRPARNTPAWFSHYTYTDPVPVTAGEAAWHLVAQLYYGAPGRCTSRVVPGAQPATAKASPLRGTVSYHPVGKNLFESLIFGVPPMRVANDEPDLCPWERDELPDPRVPWPATWPGGLLTSQYRHAVLLVPSANGGSVVDAYVTWAWQQPVEIRDPYLIYKVKPDGTLYRPRANAARAMWRDVYALLMDHADSRRPDIITTAGEHDYDGLMRIRAYGFDQDTNQAKDNQWFAAVTPPVLRWLRERDEEAALGVGEVTRAAEHMGKRLTRVMRWLWEKTANSEDKKRRDEDIPWVRAAMSFYWPRSEELFWQHVHDRAFDQAYKAFLALAHNAIDQVMDGRAYLPKFARAVAEAHRQLSAGR